MKKFLSALVLISSASLAFAQEAPAPDTTWKNVYRETATRINDLVHTRLELKPDFSKSYMYGKEWVTLKPHFYATDSLTLDAKGMEIKSISLYKGPGKPLKALSYKYDDMQLHITLDKKYTAAETYTLYIEYTSKPDEYQAKFGTDDMLGIKGLYFINPKGEDKTKPTQIWTQGETESNSAWFPTIDKTAQKTTEELTVTVDNKYVTLSNGKLMSQKKNADGTRTDYWKMDLPHSPYLFFLGVGDYAVIKDSWRGKEVNYYVEKEYASVAKKIFGNTPEMMSFFSKITGVDYPWVKYSQITGRDFVAGAMENTTATLHQENAQQDARELVDGNGWESTIAHELFHQWFGDYVTAESWSNITLNESFANYSETLWDEYKRGKDAGDAQNYTDMAGYLQSNSEDRDLVRFHYSDKEDVFDAVSYNKGGRILHMLRHEIGDSAFFKALNLYLTTNKFKGAEAQQLRLAFEDVTGRDLNWYFNQWYYGSGHPVTDISYVYDDNAGKVQVIVKQTQASGKIFKLPLDIDIYNGANKKRYTVWAKNAVDTFSFSYSKHPDLVNVDGDKILLWQKKDNKTLENFIHQYTYAGNYLDRREAIEYASKKQDDAKARNLLKTALSDKYQGLRSYAVSLLDMKKDAVKSEMETTLLNMANTEKYSIARAGAIKQLGTYKKASYTSLFKTAINDSSYTIAGAALNALGAVDAPAALAFAKQNYNTPLKGSLQNAITAQIAQSGDESMFEKVLSDFNKVNLQSKFNVVGNLATYLGAIKSTDKFKIGVDEIVKFRDEIPAAFKNQTDPYLNGVVLKGILTKKSDALKEKPNDAALIEQINYIKTKLPEEEKKGF